MARYDIRVDGRSQAVVKDEEALRRWIADYRDKHRDDDPKCAHVQLLELGRLAWLKGGKLVPLERFRA